MESHTFPHPELLDAALARLIPAQQVILTEFRPLPSFRRNAWHVIFRDRSDKSRSTLSLLALLVPRTLEYSTPTTSYAIATSAGLPTPTIRSVAEGPENVLFLCSLPSGTALTEVLRECDAPWQISAAAVSLARFLVQLHRTPSSTLGIEATAERTAERDRSRIATLREVIRDAPDSLRGTLEGILDWIDDQLHVSAPLVPTLGHFPLTTVFVQSGEVSCAFGWEQLALRPAAADFAGLLFELAPFDSAVRALFLSVVQASYLQAGGSTLADAPARALLDIVERTLIAWTARASHAFSGGPRDPFGVVRTLESAHRAARSGLAAMAYL
uniref:Aminoglycoside phosphotransferase domain-containing protein n=1 Tax=Thermomicrobium roseum TaxID=500 RepID=A0A7C1JQU6_THERO